MSVTSNLTPTNTDNITDSNSTETNNIRAVELVTLANGDLIMITSERGVVDEGVATYQIDNDPTSPTYGEIFNSAGTTNTNPTGDGSADQSARIDFININGYPTASRSGYEEILEMDAVTLSNGNTFLYTADYWNQTIGITQINADGSLTELGKETDGTLLYNLLDVATITVDGNPILLAYAEGQDSLISYQIDPTSGSLTLADTFADNASTYLNNGMWRLQLEFEAYTSQSLNEAFVVVGTDEDGISLFTIDSSGQLTNVDSRGDDELQPGDDYVPGDGETGLANPEAATFGEIDGQTYLFVGGADDDVTIYRIDDTGSSYDMNLAGVANNITTTNIGGLEFIEGDNGEYFLAIGGEQSGMVFAQVSVDASTGVVTLGGTTTLNDAGDPGAELADVEDTAYENGIMVSASDNDNGVAVITMLAVQPKDYIVEGTAGADLIDAAYADDPGRDMIDANDNIVGTNDDSIVAGGGHDTILAGDGNDTILAGDGDDTVDGGADNDSIVGGVGDDTLLGGTGADIIEGGDGDDTITFAEGDTALGGDGDDLFVLEDLGEPTNGTITVTGGNGAEALGVGDTLQLGELADMSTLNITSTTTNASGNTSYTGSITLDDGTELNFSEMEDIVCFTRGTMIKTIKGERPIEDLEPGDRILTYDRGYQPLRWIGSTRVAGVGKFAPIRFARGVLGNDRPLLVSPQHRMLLRGWQAELYTGETEVLVPATHLVNDSTITRMTGGEVEYFHLLFDQHELVFGNGCVSESFHPGQQGWSAFCEDTRQEILELFPDLLTSNFKSFGENARHSVKRNEAICLAATLRNCSAESDEDARAFVV